METNKELTIKAIRDYIERAKRQFGELGEAMAVYSMIWFVQGLIKSTQEVKHDKKAK